jgi:hypothetical protein
MNGMSSTRSPAGAPRFGGVIAAAPVDVAAELCKQPAGYAIVPAPPRGSGFWCVRADTTMRARVLSEASAMCRRLCPLSSMQRNAASQRMTRQNASVIVGLGARPVALCRSDLGSGCPRWVELVQPGWPLERSRSEHTSPSRGFGQRPSWPSPRPGLCGPSDPRRLLRNPHGRFVEVRRHGRRLHIRRRPAALASR